MYIQSLLQSQLKTQYICTEIFLFEIDTTQSQSLKNFYSEIILEFFFFLCKINSSVVTDVQRYFLLDFKGCNF